MKTATTLLIVCWTLASWSCDVLGQCLVQESETLEPIAATSGDAFGYSIDIDGDLAIIGAINADADGLALAGSATLFRHISGAWQEESQLIAGDPVAFSSFGMSVAVSANRALVGVPNLSVSGQNLAGAVYAFSYDGSNWIQDQKLIASDFDHQASFGWAVALDSDVAVIGSPGDDIGPLISAGSAYIFRHDGSQWVEEQMVTTSDAYRLDQFGWACAVQGNRAAISAVGDGGPSQTSRGALYVFEYDGSQWNESQKLVASDGSNGDLLGWSIALDNDLLVGGSLGATVGGFDGAGAAYAYRHDGSSWSQEQKLVAPVAGSQNQFGSAVGADGRHIVVGVQGNAGFTGAAYLYSHDGTVWSNSQKWTASDGGNNDNLGGALAFDGGRALLGANGADTPSGINAGAAQAFEPVMAEVAQRNGGANPDSYTASPPILGGLWTATVDLTTTGHSSALVLINTALGSTTLPLGQVLLVGGVELLQLPLSPGPIVNWVLPVPNDCTLVGLTIYTQAAHVQGSFPFALSNAQDLTFGY